MEKKLLAICEGALAIVIGVLMACFGGQTVLDIYFGVLLVVAGALFLILSIVGLVKTKVLAFGSVFAALAGLLIGSFLIARYYSFDRFIEAFILIMIAAGAALVLYGIYTIFKQGLFAGLGQIVIGGGVFALGFCYIYIPSFYKVFWIIIGVLVAVYGLFFLLNALLSKEEA